MSLADILTKPQQDALLAEVNAEAQRLIAARQSAAVWRRVGRDKQQLPPGDWRVWLILAGRGWGKTRTGAEAVRQWKSAYPRIGVIAPTAADARDTCIEGETGIRSICQPGEITKWNRSLGELEFDTGARVKLFSSEEPDRLRGPQHHKLWCDEAGAWKYPTETWDMAMLGLRLGDNPQVVVTTTPKPIKIVRDLVTAANVVVTYGSSYENRANLAPAFFEQIISRYEGTRLGRQEINAELLEDMPGALWTRTMLEACRQTGLPQLVRVVVAIDPEATSGENSAETGIMVAGKGVDGQGYLLDDATLRATPNGWATVAVASYRKWEADRMVAEANNGGEMVAATIEAVPGAPVVGLVHASKSKQARAEPIAALYERGRIHHIGAFPELEDQRCMWAPGEGQPSPDRLDALVWAFTELDIAVTGAAPGVVQKANTPVPSRFVKSQPSGSRWNRDKKTGYR